MKTGRALAVIAILAASCARSEEPAGARPARAATAAPPASSLPAPRGASPVGERPACVVPMPAEAPAKQEKASLCPTDPGGAPSLARGRLTFVDAPGSPRVEVEVADRPETRERGLMYRTSMPGDHGMLFSWPGEQVRSFWMHNTCIPLDMLFIDAKGFIVGILEQVPVLNDASRSVPCPAAHVLELNAGWARAHGVTAGQRVRIEP